MIWITTADDGNIESYAALTRLNKWEYCDRKGYHLISLHSQHPGHEESLSAPWNLVVAMRYAMRLAHDGDYIMLLGADTVILDLNFDLEHFLGIFENADCFYTHDVNGFNNNGFTLLVNDRTRAFLDAVWSKRGQSFQIGEHVWEEQGAMIKALSEISVRPALVNQEFLNGYEPCIYGPQYREPIFIAHYPGKKTEERTYFIRRALGLVERVPLPEGHWIDENGVIQKPQ